MIAEVSTIVARGMGVRRWGRWLLRPAAFGIAGGVVGLAGPPGVGKTTLLATFATLRRPHVGALDVLGYNSGNNADLRAIRARIGYLPADIDWAANLRVQEFVAYAAYYRRMARSAVQLTLAQMELADVADRELNMLPADIRLRAGLAATCVHGPELVLLDEPLTGLDQRHAAELVPLLRSLAPTVLVTGSSPAELTGWCDRVLTLAGGRLIEPTPEPAAARTATRAAVDTTRLSTEHTTQHRTEPSTQHLTGPSMQHRAEHAAQHTMEHAAAHAAQHTAEHAAEHAAELAGSLAGG